MAGAALVTHERAPAEPSFLGRRVGPSVWSALRLAAAWAVRGSPGSGRIRPPHLLLGLAGERSTVAARALRFLDLAPERLRAALVDPGSDAGEVPLAPLDPAAERALELDATTVRLLERSAREAGERHQGLDDSGDLLNALASGQEGAAALEALGVDSGRIRAVVQQARDRSAAGFGAFSSPARRAMSHARRAAFDLGHARIGTGHVLAGIAAASEGLAHPVLARAGVTEERVLQVLHEVGPPWEVVFLCGQQPLTEAVALQVVDACAGAEQRGSTAVETVDLLLALRELRDSLAMAALHALGVRAEDVWSCALAAARAGPRELRQAQVGSR